MGSESGSGRASHSSSRGRAKNRAGPYELLSVLGQGASGTVYLARRPGIERMFALKLLAADLDPEGRARVQREAQVASRLDHPGIVRVVDFGVLGPQLYIVMEHIPGPTLRDALAQGSLPPERAASIVAQIGEAMDTAHAAGVVHRDLKPANVILDARDNQPKVTDFGLARDTRAAHQLTKPGEVIGTPYYMAAEQIHGTSVDARTDVYAMGVILYELLTGRRPFEGKTVAAVVHGILNSPVVAPRKINSAIPPALEKACLRALSRKAEKRYSTARELVNDLSAPTALAAAEPTRVPPVAAAILGGLCAGLLVLVAWGVIAFANGRSYHEPLRNAQAKLIDRERDLEAAKADREAAHQEIAEVRDPAERVAEVKQRVIELEPITAEISRAAMTPTGHLALVVDGLIRDLEAIEGTEAMRANLLYNRGRFREASEIYHRARAEGDVDPELAVVEFRANSRLGDQQKAGRAMQWLLETHPESVPARFAQIVLGQRQLTLPDLQALQERSDVSFNYFHNIEIMTLANAGRIDMALESARRAIAFDPCDADAHRFLVLLLLQSWQSAGAPGPKELAECLHSYRVAADLSSGVDTPEMQQFKSALEAVLRNYGKGR